VAEPHWHHALSHPHEHKTLAAAAGSASPFPSQTLPAADGAVQDAFVEDVPELGRTRSVQNCLTGQTGGYLLI